MRQMRAAFEFRRIRDRNFASARKAGDNRRAGVLQLAAVTLPITRGCLFALLLLSVLGSCDGPTDPAESAVTHVLTVQVSGYGRGRVTSEPAGIDCAATGGSCSMTLPKGSRITLTGAPGAHSGFGGWSQACSGTGTCTLTLDRDRTAGAAFSNDRLVAADIGPAGGTIQSLDGRLTITVPPGALSSTRTLTIEHIAASELGPEFSNATISHAYLLGPDGLTFAQPVDAVLRSDQGPVESDSGVTVNAELLVTSAGGAVEPLENPRFEVSTAGITVHGQMRHFSPLAGAFRAGPWSGLTYRYDIKGVPASWLLGHDFVAEVSMHVTAYADESNILGVLYHDQSKTPLQGRGEPPRLELTGQTSSGAVVTKTFRGAFSYYCERGGNGVYQVMLSIEEDLVGSFLSAVGDLILQTKFSEDSPRATKPVNCEQSYILEVTRSGFGQGTVTSSPEGIDCGLGEGCFEYYPPGRAVALTATPEPGSKFITWSVRCSGSDPRTVVVMDDDKRCDAQFDVDPSALVTFEVSLGGGGAGTVTVQPDNNACSNSEDGQPKTCIFEYPEGTDIHVTADLGLGSRFSGWGGDCSGSDPSQQLELDGNKVCQATFVPVALRYQLTVERSGTGEGNVISAPDEGITCIEGHSAEHPDGDCSEEYDNGTTVILAAYAADGSEFVSWTGDCTPTGVPNTVEAVMNQDRTCNARFDLISSGFRVLTVVQAGGPSLHGVVTSQPEGINCGQDKNACAAEFADGTTVTLSYNSVFGSGATATYSGQGTTNEDDDFLVLMDTDREVIVSFHYGLRVSTSGTGKGLVGDLPDAEEIYCGDGGDECHAIFERGEEVTLEARPSPGSEFSQWTGDCTGTNPFVSVVMSQFRSCDAEFVTDVAVVPTLTPGVRSMGDLRQAYRTTVFNAVLANLTSRLPLIGFGGGTVDGVGMAAVYNLETGTYVLRRHPFSYVFGTLAAYEVAAAATVFFTWGLDGLALYSSQSPFGEEPVEMRTDVRISDAVHAGGGGPSDAIVFGSRDLGVGFVRYNPTLGRYSVSEEVLPKSDFVGDLLWAYIDNASGPAVVLSRSSASRLYFHRRNGTAPTVVATGLGLVNNLRCLPPVCIVFPASNVGVPVFLFDGQNMPTRAADAALSFVPLEAALRRTSSGTVAALMVGREGSADRVVEVEFAANGSVVRVVPMARPSACSGVNGAAYVPDGGGVAAVVSCTGSHNFFIERSALFPAP